MTTATPFIVGVIKNAFFIRCDSRRSTPGGCFPQTSLSAPYRVQLRNAGDFAEPFPPPLRASFRARRSSLWSRPARVCATLDPRQGAPCTRPAPSFLPGQGLMLHTPTCNRKTNVYPPEKQTTDRAESARSGVLEQNQLTGGRSPRPGTRRRRRRTRCSRLP